MQFHLFLSNTYQNAFLQVLNKLKKESAIDTTKKHFFVVPDRITLNAEKRIFEELNIDCTFNIEVITLSKLANKVLGSLLTTKKVLTKQSGIMLTTKVILNHKKNLKAFSRATHYSGFTESVYETIMQLKSCNITPTKFLNSQSTDNISLKLKVQDIALLYEAYEKELEQGYLDASSKLNLLSEQIAKSELIKGANFYFTLFDSFTPQQYGIIAKLVNYATSVNIGITSNTKQNNAHIYPTDMYDNLTNIAKQFGMNVKDIIVNEKEQFVGATHHLLENFNAYKKPIYLLKTNNIKLFEAKTIIEEVEFVASSILKAVYENERYFNINVAVSDMNTYAPIIEQVFSRYNLPFYLDKSTSLLEHHFVKHLMQGIKCAKNNYLNTDLISYTKNYFTNLTSDQQNLFEDAVLQFDINHTQFLKKFTFESKNKQELNNIRKEIVKDISFFTEKENKVSYYIKKINEFFEHKNVLTKLSKLENTYEQNNNIVEQKRTSQVYEKVQKLLLELNELLGQETVTITEFYELLLQGLKATTLSTTPASVDCIFVGEVANNNFIKSNTLFLLGANDGMLPKLKSDVGIILEDELNKLNEKVLLEPSIFNLNKKAKFNMFHLLLTADKKLVISYSRQNDKGTEQKPSSIIAELQSLFFVKGESKNVPLPVYTMEKLLFNDKQNNWTPFYYANVKVAMQKWLKEVKQSQKEDNKTSEQLNNLYYLFTHTINYKEIANYITNFKQLEEVETLTNAHTLFFSNARTKVSQLESYFMCPFKHFLDYGLKLREKERAGVRPIDVGIILHKVAEEFGKLLKQNQIITSLKDVSSAIIDTILKSPEYAPYKEHMQYKNIMQSLKEESLRLIEAIYNEQQCSEFKLSELEFSFGLKNENSVLNFNIAGKNISFAGVVDRVDTFNDYFRIIDYKTGKSDFSFKELYFGKKIQLFLYASVYRMLTGKIPAGVFYFPIKNEFEDEGKTTKVANRMQGAILDNLAIVKAFDKTLSASNQKSSFVYLTIKADKQNNIINLDHHTKKRSFTEDEFNKIETYIKNIIETALQEIVNGNITPSPLLVGSSKICDYCEYKNTCPIFANLKNYERKTNKVDLKTITEAK
ncbi:MAG: hypothetical protein CVV59_00015 [Tenericutes bacterium HGW-Tenericutes-4]|nr:MAG: hypothetical protein CVV59_00015 [Tenericutes bacterium HGW-Tenericutes-4]